MQIQKCVVLDRYEAETVAAAARSVGVAFPLDVTDPVQLEANRRAHSRLRSVSQHNDLLKPSMIAEALIVLDDVETELLVKMNRDHWMWMLFNSANPEHPISWEQLDVNQQFAVTTLTQDFTLQRQKVRTAGALLRLALDTLGHDEPVVIDALNQLPENA